MNSLKPASCRRLSASFAPGNIATWSGSRKYSFSSMIVPSRSRNTARLILKGPWDGLHALPPHPGPLPWGEGEWYTGSRSHPCRSLPNDHRLNNNQPPAVLSPLGRGSGRGGNIRPNTHRVTYHGHSSVSRDIPT